MLCAMESNVASSLCGLLAWPTKMLNEHVSYFRSIFLEVLTLPPPKTLKSIRPLNHP